MDSFDNSRHNTSVDYTKCRNIHSFNILIHSLVKFCPKIVSPNPDTNESFEPFSRAVLSLGLLREITTNGFGKDINSVTFRGLILLAAQDNEKHPTIARQAKSILMHEIVKIQKETKKSPGMKNGTKVKDLINAETCVALLRPMKSCIKHQTVEEVNEMELFLCSNGFDYLTESFDCSSDSKRFDNTGNRFHDVNEDFNCISGVQLSSNVSLDRTIENSKPIRKFNESALTALIASIVTPNDSKTKSLYSNSMTSMTNSRHQKDRDCIIPSGSRAIQLLTKARCGSNQCYINSSHLNVLIKTLLKANHFGCLRLAQQLWCESQYSNVSNTLGKNTSAKLLHMLCDFYTADKKRSIVNSSITKYSITPLINYYLYTINDNGDAILNNKSKKNKQLSKENIRQHFNSNLVQALCRACGLCGDIENVRYFIDCFQNDETSSQPKSFLKSSEIRVAVRALTDVGGLREAFHLLKKNSNFAIHSKNADQKQQAEFNWSILFDCIEKDVDLDVARDAMHFMIIRQNLFPDVDGNIRKSLDNMMVRLASARRRIHLAEQSNLNLSDRVVSKQHFPVLGFAGLESEQQSNNNILSKQNVSNQPVMNDSILRGDVAFDISNILWPLQEDIEEDTSSEATSCEAQNRKEYKSKTVMMDKNTKSKDESKSYASAYISKHMSSETISSSLQLIAAEGSHLLQSDNDDCRNEILEEHVDNMFDLLENVLFEWDPRLIISH